MKASRFQIIGALVAMMALGAMVYWPGLRGGFIFDDYPNLSALGSYGGVRDWQAVKEFVFSGFAGPLGRPVALMSFLLDANNWPAAPRPFKLSNLWIHLITGLALYWATLNVLRFYGGQEARSRWVAVLNMAFWLLHPYMVSTTLYVVQRMAQLAALFMFAGLAGYLHGRLLLLRGRARAGYVWMSASLIAGTLMAAFSKENGMLLPLLVLVVEFCRPVRNDGTDSVQPDWRWRALFLWLPTLAVSAALLSELNLSPQAWPTRPFNQVQRLLTEPRILWEYLYHLYVPRIEGRGLFQDGYQISTGWLHPWTTLPSILGLLALFFGAIWLRRKWPWGSYVALAVLFFLAAHVMESSLIGLELYFEHRNYAAAAFLFLPLAMVLVWMVERRSRLIGLSGVTVLLVLLAGLTWQRATLWGDTEALQTYWAVTSPSSPRAQNRLAARLLDQGDVPGALRLLDQAMTRLPDSALLSMQWLLTRVQYGVATSQDFDRVRLALPRQRFDAQAVMALRVMAEYLSDPSASAYQQQALELVDAMSALERYRRVPVFNRLAPYLRGMLLMGQRKVEAATDQFLLAIPRYHDTDAALAMMAVVANAGYPKEALKILNAARALYDEQPTATLKRSRNVYDMEFHRLNQMLDEDVRARETKVHSAG